MSFEVGQKVAVIWQGSVSSVETIKAITNDEIQLSNGYRFDATTTHRLDTNYRLRPVSKGDEISAEERELKYKLGVDVEWDDLPLATLRRVAAALEGEE